MNDIVDLRLTRELGLRLVRAINRLVTRGATLRDTDKIIDAWYAWADRTGYPYDG